MEFVKAHWLSILAALLALVVVGLGTALYAAEQDTRPHARAGVIYGADESDAELAHTGTAYLPWNEVEVGFSDPTDELPGLGSPEAEAGLQAPEDGSFVRVRVQRDPAHAYIAFSTDSDLTTDVDIVLRAGDKDYPLTVPGGFDLDPNLMQAIEGDRWIAVEGHPHHLEVRITVDGKTQVVGEEGSELGRAEAFSTAETGPELSYETPTNCGQGKVRSSQPVELVDYSRSCKLIFGVRTPYVDGLGWAKDGHEFYIVQIEPPPFWRWQPVAGDAAQAWGVDRATWSATLGGRPTAADPDEPTSDHPSNLTHSNGEQFIFAVKEGEPLGELVLRATTVERLSDPFADRPARKAAMEWTLPQRKLR